MKELSNKKDMDRAAKFAVEGWAKANGKEKMSDKEVLKAAITRVIKNGWNTKWDGPLFHGLSVNNGEVVFDKEEVYGNIFDFRGLESLLFDHDFCKALWPDPENYNENVPSWGEALPYWKACIQELATSEDRIDYLRRNI